MQEYKSDRKKYGTLYSIESINKFTNQVTCYDNKLCKLFWNLWTNYGCYLTFSMMKLNETKFVRKSQVNRQRKHDETQTIYVLKDFFIYWLNKSRPITITATWVQPDCPIFQMKHLPSHKLKGFSLKNKLDIKWFYFMLQTCCKFDIKILQLLNSTDFYDLPWHDDCSRVTYMATSFIYQWWLPSKFSLLDQNLVSKTWNMLHQQPQLLLILGCWIHTVVQGS